MWPTSNDHNSTQGTKMWTALSEFVQAVKENSFMTAVWHSVFVGQMLILGILKFREKGVPEFIQYCIHVISHVIFLFSMHTEDHTFAWCILLVIGVWDLKLTKLLGKADRCLFPICRQHSASFEFFFTQNSCHCTLSLSSGFKMAWFWDFFFDHLPLHQAPLFRAL